MYKNNVGCFMDLLKVDGDDIKNLTGIADSSSCNEQCQRTQNCSLWTYFDGICYMKNERTFMIRTDNGIISGKKDCIGDGKTWQFYL